MLTGGKSYRLLLDRARQKLDEIIEQIVAEITIFSHTRNNYCFLAQHLMGALDALETEASMDIECELWYYTFRVPKR